MSLYTHQNAAHGEYDIYMTGRRVLTVLTGIALIVFAVLLLSTPQRHTAHHPDTTSNGFALIINTYRRHALLLQQLQLYTRCPAVAQVHVLWSESPTPPDTIIEVPA